MLFNTALFTGLLLAPGALAVPSGSAAQLTRQRCKFGGDTNNTFYNHIWAGAILTQDNGTFQHVSGTFTVPTPSYPSDTDVDTDSSWVSASAWVGIDGHACSSSLLETGVHITVDNGQAHYNAWYQWWPGFADNFPDINISAGDVIRLTVVATTTTTGNAMIDNLSNGQTASKNLTSTIPLCQQNAEWIVEDYALNQKLVPFANFSEVTFTDAVAGNRTAFYTPADAQIAEIEQDNVVLTSVSTCDLSVTITYL